MNALSPSLEHPRGQPLLVFAMILGGWLVLRVLLWEAPFAESAPVRMLERVFAPEAPVALSSPRKSTPATTPGMNGQRHGPTFPRPNIRTRHDQPLPASYLALAAPFDGTAASRASAARPSPSRIIGHHLLLAAAFSHMEVPPEIAAYFSVAGPPAKGVPPHPADRPLVGLIAQPADRSVRWSGDAWLFLRRDSVSPLAAGRPAYGRSQAGAVLRYRLAPSSGHRPVAYVRASRALAGAREGEVAAGLAVRPVPALPVSVAAELRVYDSGTGRREVRPAAFAVTELPPVQLPYGLRGEAYAQAGYVGGSFATAFTDGQVRVDRRVARLGDAAELRAGAAAWGGAQKGAARLDIGPSAAVSFRLGETNSRLAVDYRLRVAGDAEPKSGPALTFSAGF